MVGAAEHLRQATEHINEQKYADSIADSINAVESVARKIDPKASNTLGQALDSLEKGGLLWSGYPNWSTGRVSLERLILKLSW